MPLSKSFAEFCSLIWESLGLEVRLAIVAAVQKQVKDEREPVLRALRAHVRTSQMEVAAAKREQHGAEFREREAHDYLARIPSYIRQRYAAGNQGGRVDKKQSSSKQKAAPPAKGKAPPPKKGK